MDKLPHNTQNTFAFIDDILIVIKGTKQQYMDNLEEVLKVLDEAGIQLKLEKGKIAQAKAEWLCYKLSEKGNKPIDEKIQANIRQTTTKTLKELRSLMGALNQMNRFIPNLAKLCAPLRLLLRKENKWKWGDEQEKAFQQFKKEIKQITGSSTTAEDGGRLAAITFCIKISNNL